MAFLAYSYLGVNTPTAIYGFEVTVQIRHTTWVVLHFSSIRPACHALFDTQMNLLESHLRRPFHDCFFNKRPYLSKSSKKGIFYEETKSMPPDHLAKSRGCAADQYSPMFG